MLVQILSSEMCVLNKMRGFLHCAVRKGANSFGRNDDSCYLITWRQTKGQRRKRFRPKGSEGRGALIPSGCFPFRQAHGQDDDKKLQLQQQQQEQERQRRQALRLWRRMTAQLAMV
jgi:hypothetical protein